MAARLAEAATDYDRSVDLVRLLAAATVHVRGADADPSREIELQEAEPTARAPARRWPAELRDDVLAAVERYDSHLVALGLRDVDVVPGNTTARFEHRAQITTGQGAGPGAGRVPRRGHQRPVVRAREGGGHREAAQAHRHRQLPGAGLAGDVPADLGGLGLCRPPGGAPAPMAAGLHSRSAHRPGRGPGLGAAPGLAHGPCPVAAHGAPRRRAGRSAAPSGSTSVEAVDGRPRRRHRRRRRRWSTAV